MATTFKLKRKLFYQDLGHGQTGLTAGANRAMDFAKKSSTYGSAGSEFNSKLTASAERAYQKLFKPSNELSTSTTKPVSTGNQSVRRSEGIDKNGRQIWNESAVTNLAPTKTKAAQQKKQITQKQKESRKVYDQQVKQDKLKFADTVKQNKTNLQHQQAMRAKAANNVGVGQGMRNTWNNMGTMGKVGTVAAGATVSGLALKGLFGGKKKRKDED